MLISIITVNYNDARGLENTIKSVQGQSYPNCEHIIIDGDSNDGSKAVIEQFLGSFSYWISEPDSGIYNAMNKGIEKAKGDYLLFLNSGDCLNNKDVVNDFVSLNPVEDFVYGDSLFMFEEKENLLVVMPDSLEGIVVFRKTLNHQSVFFKGTLFNNGKRFDENYKIVADWAFYNEEILINNKTYRHIDLVISNYDTNGLSSDENNKAIMESERNLFYSKHAEHLIPLLLNEYKILNAKYNKLRSLKIFKLVRKIKRKWQKFF